MGKVGVLLWKVNSPRIPPPGDSRVTSKKKKKRSASVPRGVQKGSDGLAELLWSALTHAEVAPAHVHAGLRQAAKTKAQGAPHAHIPCRLGAKAVYR